MVSLKGVTNSFGELQVLKGITHTFQKGKTTVIVGASGSGKSTLLRCLNQLVEIDQGEIIINQKDINEYNHSDLAKEVGMVFQQFNLFHNMTVIENVMYALIKVKKMSPSLRKSMWKSTG